MVLLFHSSMLLRRNEKALTERALFLLNSRTSREPNTVFLIGARVS